MTIEQSTIDSLVETIYRAYTEKEPITPLTDETELTVADAYDIQTGVIDRILGDDGELMGYKLGLVSAAKQEQLGIDEPIFCPVPKALLLEGPVPTEDLIAPRLEAEIGLILDDDLTPPVSTTDVLANTRSVVPVIEILESRFESWTIPSAQDVIADITSDGFVIVGEAVRDESDVDLAMEGVTLSQNGELVETGLGADIMGNPAHAVSWLGDRLGSRDSQLEAGQLVMTGGITAAVDIEPGDVFTVTFSRLGSVEVHAT